MIKKLFLSACLSLALFANGEAEIKGNRAEVQALLQGMKESVHLSAEAEITLESKEATASFVIKSKEDKLSEAIIETRAIFTRIAKGLKAQGFKAEDIKTDAFSIVPRFSFYAQAPSSFSVQKPFEIKVRNEDDFLRILSLTEREDDIVFVKLEPLKADLEKPRLELEKKCLDKLKLKQARYEEALGIKLVIRSFDFDDSAYKTPSLAQQLQGSSSLYSKISMGQASVSASLEKPSGAFGKFKLRASIHAKYLLKSNKE